MAVFVWGFHGRQTVIGDAVIKTLYFRWRNSGIFSNVLLYSFRNHLITNNFPHILFYLIHGLVVGIFNDFGVAPYLRKPIVDLVRHTGVHLLVRDDDAIHFSLVLVKLLSYELLENDTPSLFFVVHRAVLGCVVRIFCLKVRTHDDFLSDNGNNLINGGLPPQKRKRQTAE